MLAAEEEAEEEVDAEERRDTRGEGVTGVSVMGVTGDPEESAAVRHEGLVGVRSEADDDEFEEEEAGDERLVSGRTTKNRKMMEM